MTIADLLELLIRFKAREITTKYVMQQLADVDLETMLKARRAQSPKQPQPTRPTMKEWVDAKIAEHPPVQEAPPEVENKIHQMFEGSPPAGGKEQFHAENKQGKRCFDDYVAKEHEQGVFHADPGSSPFTANLPGRCVGCGQVILKGDVIIIRTKERGVA